VGAYLATEVIYFEAISGTTNITFADISMHVYPYLPRGFFFKFNKIGLIFAELRS
jgi:hypothetical protein